MPKEDLRPDQDARQFILVDEAIQHNLKNISLAIPKHCMVVVTGVSGSGKSALVHDTISAVAQTELMSFFSSYVQRYVQHRAKPHIGSLRGVPAAVTVGQKPIGPNSRSTVGTFTEAYSFLRLLFSRLGSPILDASAFSFNNAEFACPQCKGLGTEMSVDVSRLIDFNRSLDEGAILHRAWKPGSRYMNIIVASRDFPTAKPLRDFSEDELNKLLYSEPTLLSNQHPGFVQSFTFEGVACRILARIHDVRRQDSSPYEAGFVQERKCSLCHGSRLNALALSVTVQSRTIAEVASLELTELKSFLQELDGPVAKLVVEPLQHLVDSLAQTGLGYLTLDRPVATLSGGEAQRVKLAKNLFTPLSDLLYIIDEPTSGLHPQDVEFLIPLLRGIPGRGNSLLIVEHNWRVICSADHIIEMGPAGGTLGGYVIFDGPASLFKERHPALESLSSDQETDARYSFIKLLEFNTNNLRIPMLELPTQALVGICGVSGSGKSTLAGELSSRLPGAIMMDQTLPGANARSVVATYSNVLDTLRDLFSKATGQDPSLFTFNGKGACPDCNGLGVHTMDMQFLGDVSTLCETCLGSRYIAMAEEYRVNGYSISEVLALSVEKVQGLFASEDIDKKLRLLSAVGLGYLCLNQVLSSLSGGELLRLKLASRLATKRGTFILDEPSRGLGSTDLNKLVTLFKKMVKSQNTIIVVDHDVDLLRSADWLIELGPGAGKRGGMLQFSGTPYSATRDSTSQIGRYLDL